jgi:hypothetical protein
MLMERTWEMYVHIPQSYSTPYFSISLLTVCFSLCVRLCCLSRAGLQEHALEEASEEAGKAVSTKNQLRNKHLMIIHYCYSDDERVSV